MISVSAPIARKSSNASGDAEKIGIVTQIVEQALAEGWSRQEAIARIMETPEAELPTRRQASYALETVEIRMGVQVPTEGGGQGGVSERQDVVDFMVDAYSGEADGRARDIDDAWALVKREYPELTEEQKKWIIDQVEALIQERPSRL